MKRAPRPFVGIVADDITGSGDIGVMFAKHGYAVRIFSAETDLNSLPDPLAGKRTDVIIIDTDSRLDLASVAYEKVRRATAALRRAGCTRFWKKTCSVFRGNVGAEFDAMLDELGAPFGVAVAAFPKNGRQTHCGLHYVHGKLLADSEFAHDPVHPMTESSLVSLVQGQTRRRVGLLALQEVRSGPAAVKRGLDQLRRDGIHYAVCDAMTQDDLETIAEAAAEEAVLLGSSALAEELPGVWTLPADFNPLAGFDLKSPGGTLVIAGSVMPQTRAQVEALQADGARVITLEGAAALADADATTERLAAEAAARLAAGENVVVRTENWPEAVGATRRLGAESGLSPVEVSRHLSGLLARIAGRVLRQTGSRRLITLGGDTSAAVCRALGITETLVLDEIEPGLPATLAPDLPLLLVLKSGSFGKPEFVQKAIHHLERLGG
ncbi:MAG TPA: four-carbon acid sugar kinase family protein [Symbiobacteriaceae bacterium]|nr:four-carbon acid sugar kinase family protein [Symbiobacteriaceae bacterium]